MKDMNCEQIKILLAYFIDNKLNKKIMSDIEYHLNICAECRERYMNLLRINQNYREIKEKICSDDKYKSLIPSYNEKEYQIFQANLSAYIDNELNDRENIRIKKFAIINPEARQELEDLIYFRQLLQDSFTKTKSQFKQDLSERTINILKENIPTNDKREFSAAKKILFFTIYLLFIICSIIVLNYT